MKRGALSGLCIILLLALSLPAFAAGEAGNETQIGNATRAAQRPAKPETTCGNGKMDPGETCLTCLNDVCRKGEMCNEETAECESAANFTLYIIVAAGIFALFALFFVAKRLTKKPEEPLPKPQLMQQNPMPAQKAGAQQPEQKQAAEMPAMEKAAEKQGQKPAQKPAPETPAEPVQQPVQLPPQKTDAAAGGPAVTGKPEEEKPQEDSKTEEDEHKGETQIQRFIRQRRESGWADEQIRQKMKETGWKDMQIALEFLKAPKFAKKQ